MRLPTLSLLASLAIALPLSAQNLLTNAGFEGGKVSWVSFIPADSTAHSPVLDVVQGTARTGRSALRLSSAVPSRFAFGNYPLLAVAPGERYRISAWFRAEPDAVAEPAVPGFLLRANFSSQDAAPGTPAKHLYLGPTGLVSSSIGPHLRGSSLPTDWVGLTAVVEVPENTDRLSINLFSWGLTGAVLVDDTAIELVPFSVAPTALTDANGMASTPAPVASTPPPLSSTTSPASLAGPDLPRIIPLTNPGFESGLRGWNNLADSGMSRSTPEAASRGDGGLRVEDSDPVRGSSLRSALFPASAGQAFRVKFTARSVSGDGIAVYLAYSDQSKRGINLGAREGEHRLMIAPGLTDFTPQTFVSKAPAGAAFAQIWIHSFTSALVVADFDDFELIEVAP